MKRVRAFVGMFAAVAVILAMSGGAVARPHLGWWLAKNTGWGEAGQWGWAGAFGTLGALGGAELGAELGSLGGPIGAVIGGGAGAV